MQDENGFDMPPETELSAEEQSIRDARMRELNDTDRKVQLARYEAEALADANARAGCFGAAGSNLLKMCYVLETDIAEVVRKASSPIAALPELKTALQTISTMHRQAGRFSHLELQWRRADK